MESPTSHEKTNSPMKKLGLCVAALVLTASAALWFNYGTIHPCGILRETSRQVLKVEFRNPLQRLAQDTWFDQQTPRACLRRLRGYFVEGKSLCLSPIANERSCETGDLLDTFGKSDSESRSNLSAKQAELIDRLRREAETLSKEGKVFQPLDANARRRYQQILEIDPNDQAAKQRLDEIERIP
jgi:hypothetical protein